MSTEVKLPDIPNKDRLIYTYKFEIELYDPDNEKVKVKP
jgi:hypothetical protein